MSEPFATCDCCGRDIPYGKPHLTITRSIEVGIRSIVNNQDEADVLDAEAILTLCQKCSNAYNAEFFKLVVSNIPFKAKRVREN